MNNSLIVSTSSIDLLDDRKNISDKLGVSQWNLLTEIESRYMGKAISGTLNIFEHDIWLPDIDASITQCDNIIKWNNHCPNVEQYPQVLMLKIFADYCTTIKDASMSTVTSKVARIRRFLTYMSENFHLLVGLPNNALIGVDAITQDNVESYMDQYIQKGFIHGMRHFSYDIEVFFECLKTISADYVFMKVGNVLPWKKANMTSDEWIKQRMKDLGVIPIKASPYKSLSIESSAMLVEKSMDILDIYSDDVVELIAEANPYNVLGDRYSYNQRREHSESLKGKFDSILPITLDPGTNNIKLSWYSKLFLLAQAAMLNIILLTTGLRNSDVRTLLVGCCKKSEIDDLWYIETRLTKTSNAIHIPVPEQTARAVAVLEKLRIGESRYLLAHYTGRPAVSDAHKLSDSNNQMESENRNLKYDNSLSGGTINSRLKSFAHHYNISMVVSSDEDSNDIEATCHCYRATVAGWLASASNLSVLLVRRLFGHSNDLMPMSYLHHNPFFEETIEETKKVSARNVALRLATAAKSGNISGVKGNELHDGYEYQNNKCQSATDRELFFDSFVDQLADRITDGMMCGFITPLSIICGRNPNDTSPTPCASKAYKNEIAEKEIDKELIKHLSFVAPDMCVGNKCKEAMIGEWSASLKDSFVWYANYLKGLYGDNFLEVHYEEEARRFVAQYAEDIKKVFDLEFSDV